MKVTLRVWRQKDSESAGKFEEYEAEDLNPNMSFLEMLDVVNESLTEKGEEPIAFAHDCREGICGTCSCMIDGKPTDLSLELRPAKPTCAAFRMATS